MDTKAATDRIKFLLETISSKVLALNKNDLTFRRAPGKWSKQEVLGHLCDSAMNNLARFINAQYKPKPFAVNTYDQDECVIAGHYQEMNIADVIDFWKAMNRNIINVISFYNTEQLGFECYSADGEFGSYVPEEKPEYTSRGGMRTLYWLIEDYTAHMEYHLKQIIDY